MKHLNKLILAGFLALASLAALGGSYTDGYENSLVDSQYRGQAYTIPTTLYIGLDTGACTEAGGGTEVTGGSYARVAVVSSLANWAGTQGAGTTTASTGTSGTTSNNIPITFPTPTANWGQVFSFRIWPVASGGSAIVCQTLTTPKTVNNGDPGPAFGIGALTIQVDN